MVVVNKTYPTICIGVEAVIVVYAAQSSWSNGSSMDTMGYLSTKSLYKSPRASEDNYNRIFVFLL
jgi:hypothetical protein